MDMREKFIDCVKNGSDEPVISIQIGAGAGFDTKLAGKEWISETTMDDLISAYQQVGGLPLYNLGLPDLGQYNEELRWETKTERSDKEIKTEKQLETPYGTITQSFNERKKVGIVPLEHAVTIDDGENAFNIINWYSEQHLKGKDHIAEALYPHAEKIKEHGPLSIQWNIQPFEMFGLPTVDNLVMLAKMYPEQFRKTCDNIRDINKELIKEVFKLDVDFVFLGGPGAEMMSPDLYNDYIIPDSREITGLIHETGGLVYCHICSPVEPFLSRGCYSELGIDLFETLSPPPVGNADLRKARQEILPGEMCTRGNIGLDVLLNGSQEEVEKATLEVLEVTKGYKHMTAASDYLFYDIPLENAKKVVETVENYK